MKATEQAGGAGRQHRDGRRELSSWGLGPYRQSCTTRSSPWALLEGAPARRRADGGPVRRVAPGPPWPAACLLLAVECHSHLFEWGGRALGVAHSSHHVSLFSTAT